MHSLHRHVKFLFDDADGQVLSVLASGGSVCSAMRASSDDDAGGSRTSGGARRSAPSIPTCLESWVFLCLYMALHKTSAVKRHIKKS
jgi:hypothetical protein